MPLLARPPRSSVAVLLVLLTVGSGVFAAYAVRERIEEMVAAPAENEVRPATPIAMSPEERAFYEHVGPRLQAMVAESSVLVALGRERSRNLVELQVRSDRVTPLASEIDEYIVNNPSPRRLQEAVSIYHAAVVELRAGIGTAQSGFFTFDWDAVAVGLEMFERGATRLNAASSMLRDAVTSSGTPQAGVSPTTGARTFRAI